MAMIGRKIIAQSHPSSEQPVVHVCLGKECIFTLLKHFPDNRLENNIVVISSIVCVTN